jgi:ParB family chromosome partitioning protein
MDEKELFALIESMRAVGQLQAIIVKSVGDRFEVVAGHRRLKAAQYLRWPTILATILDGSADLHDAAKCHENAFRESIQPEDEGRHFEYLARERKLGVKEIAELTNRSHYYVETRLACLTWPPDIRDALRNGILGLGAAEALAEITEDAERQRLLAYAAQGGVSARTARSWADAWLISKQQVDVAQLAAAQANTPIKFEEPYFPCFGCERPTPISKLQTFRLCGECYNEFNDARRNAETNQLNPTSREYPTEKPTPDTETNQQRTT